LFLIHFRGITALFFKKFGQLKSRKNISIKKKKAVAVISSEDKLKEANQKIIGNKYMIEQ